MIIAMMMIIIIIVIHKGFTVQLDYHHYTKHTIEIHSESSHIIHTMMNELQIIEFQFCHSYNRYHSPYTMVIVR